ncbi:MAG: serine hydrolase [Candidatus Latescibacterota bacterium]
MSVLGLSLVFRIFLIGLAAAQSSVEPDLPFSVPEDQIRPLRQLLNSDLQKSLEKHLKRHKVWARLIAKKKMAVGLVDLSRPDDVRFARVNGNVMMYAASLPKLAILLAAFQAIEDGTLEETPEVLHDMGIMISQFNNQAATLMIDRLGFEEIESVLTDPRYELYDTRWGGGLWVGKRFAKYGERHPDPVMGVSHGATASQVCRFYYLLAMGKLVNRERSRQMLDILSDPEIHHKFVHTLDDIVPDAKLYRKSGTWKQWHSDSVLVWGPVWRRYIVVALIEDPNGEQILRDLILTVEEVLKSRSQVPSLC